MRSLKFIYLLISSIIFTVSCSEDDTTPVILDQSKSDYLNVLVINEGNFLSAEGSITGYSDSTGVTIEDFYYQSNGFRVSATIQRIEEFNDSYFVTTNNPDKLEMLNVDSLFFENSIITGFNTPYSFAAVDNKGYVTNWGTYNSATFSYDNPFLAVIDLIDFTITSTIDWESQPQDLQVVGDKLYISNVNSNSITILDTNTDEITGSIETPFGPDKMELDANGKMWVICTSGAFVKIDLNTNTIETTIDNVTTSGFNEKMVFNASRDKIYYLSTVYAPDFSATTSVFEIDINATTAPTEPIVSGTSFYGIGISDQNVIFVGDHNNYQGNGTVYMYDQEGNSLGEFESGIVPNGFIFR